jgi:spore coat protein U-like protein
LLANSLCALLLPCASVPAFAVSAVATINVTVTRYLSIVNTSSMEFGSISVSATAGTVVLGTDGMRFSTGGVTINPAGSFTPATFVIAGKPDANFVIKLPEQVTLRDGQGNIIKVDNFSSSAQTGQLDANGVLEIKVGGQINLDPNQTSGDYSGTLIVELHYG